LNAATLSHVFERGETISAIVATGAWMPTPIKQFRGHATGIVKRFGPPPHHRRFEFND
jgi:hypothetical protein